MKYFIVALMMTILSLYAALDHQITTINDLKTEIKTAQIHYNALKLATGYLMERYVPPDNPPYLWPVVPEDYDGHGRISSYYGLRDDPLRANIGGSDFKDHPAIDITGLPGARVQAVAAGIVLNKWYEAGWHGGRLYAGHPDFNGYVEIQHQSMVSEIFYTGQIQYSYPSGVYDGTISTYGHIGSILIYEDDYVEAGQPIARINGRVDKKSTGPHLDFRLLDPEGDPVNPLRYLKRGD